MKKIQRPQELKFSNFKLLQATRNVHALINNKAREYLKQHELARNFDSIQYRVNKFLADVEIFQICLSIAVKRRIRLYETIKHYWNHYRKKVSKAWLYKFQKIFINNFIYTRTYSLEKSLDKARTPKHIHWKYSS